MLCRSVAQPEPVAARGTLRWSDEEVGSGTCNACRRARGEPHDGRLWLQFARVSRCARKSLARQHVRARAYARRALGPDPRIRRAQQRLFWRLMQREVRTPRSDFESKVEKLGLFFHSVDGQPYWQEGAAYRFEAHEVNELESATNTLHELCLEACLNPLDKNIYAPVVINRDGSSSDENYDSLISYRPTIFNISQSKYAQKRGISPNLLGGRSENMSLIMNQRRSILHTLLTKQITCLLPGNFELICGSKIYLDYPYSGQRQEGEENKDKIIAGNYLIVDVRHKISYNKHVTFINVASGYSQLPIAVSNHSLQQAAING